MHIPPISIDFGVPVFLAEFRAGWWLASQWNTKSSILIDKDCNGESVAAIWVNCLYTALEEE